MNSNQDIQVIPTGEISGDLSIPTISFITNSLKIRTCAQGHPHPHNYSTTPYGILQSSVNWFDSIQQKSSLKQRLNN